MEDLREWIESQSKDYQTGVQLYLKYGRNVILQTRFQRGDRFRMIDKLSYELTKIGRANGIEKHIEIQLPGEYIPTPKIYVEQLVEKYLGKQPTKYKPDESEPIIQELMQDNRTLQVARAKLSNKYHELTTLEERKSNHQAIEDIFIKHEDVSNKLYYMEQYGRFPDEGVIAENSDNINELKYKKKRLQDKKTKANGNLKKILPNDAKAESKKAHYENVKAQAQAEIDDINLRIQTIHSNEQKAR